MYKIDEKTKKEDIIINNNNVDTFAYKKILKFNLKYLAYLLNNDPKKVVSKVGVKIRKLISPAVRKLVPLFVETKVEAVREEELPKDKKIIFVATHGFKDDVAQTIKIANKHAYFLFASLPSFFSTINGLSLWLNGVTLFNRKNDESIKSVLPKLERTMELGADVIMCSEGVWNKSPNKAVLKLFSGAYRLAKSQSAVIVPISTVKIGSKVYYVRDKAFDITQFDKVEGLKVLRDKLASGKYEIYEKHSIAKRSDFGSREETDLYFENYLKELEESAEGFYDKKLEDTIEYRDENEKDFHEVMPIKLIKTPLKLKR